jgi:hypothetical protein
MGFVLTALLNWIVPLVVQNLPVIIGWLVATLSPSMASKAPAAAAAVSATTVVKSSSLSTIPVSTLSVAASSPVITFVQEVLTGLGHPVTVDGQIGPETIGAIETSLGLASGGVASMVINDLLAKFDPSSTGVTGE